MEKSDSPTTSLLRTFKISWANTLKVFFDLNVEKITSCEVTDSGDLVINGNEYKLDVANYTGHSDRYIFFNPNNGRIVVETSGVKRIYKLEVDLLDH